MNSKTVSLIIPVYNMKDYLDRCMQSVFAQTYRSLEILLIDDGSKDESATLCDEYAKKDPRVRVIHKQNGGLSSARNAGLDVATGDYISFLDSDDFIHPQMIELLVYGLEKADADLSICYIQNTESSEIPESNINFDAYTVKNRQEYWHMGFEGKPAAPQLVMCPAKLYRRACIEGLRFPVGVVHEDVIWVSNYAPRLSKAVVYTNGLYYYYQRPGSIMHAPSPKSLCNRLAALLYKNQTCLSYFPEQMDESRVHFLRYFFIILGQASELDNDGKRTVKRWIVKNRRVLKKILKPELTSGQKLTFSLFPLLSTRLFFILFEYRFDLHRFLSLHLNKKKN